MGDLLEIKNKLKQDFDDVYYKGQLETLNNYESFKGEVSGVAIAVNDVSSINHNVGVQLRSKNLFDYNKFINQANSVQSGWGGTTTQFGEECFWFKGVPPSSSFKFMQGEFLENTQYTLSFECAYVHNNDVSYTLTTFVIYYTDGTKENVARLTYTDKFVQHSHTTKANKTVDYITTSELASTVTIYIKTNIQLELGTTATKYTPYISDFSTVEVSRYGKNLYSASFADWFINTSPYAYRYIANTDWMISIRDKDDSVDVSGCYFGITNTPNNGREIGWSVNNGKVVISNNVAQNISRQTTSEGVLCPYLIMYPKNEETLNKIMQRWDIQVELGTTATPYEPYIEPTTYTAKSDGTVGRIIYGKNLFNVNLDPHFIHYAVSLVSLNDGELTIKQNYNIGYASYSIAIPNANNLVGKTITVSCDCKVGEGGNNTSVRMMWLNANGAAAAGTDILYKPYVSSTEYQHISVSGVVNAQPDESHDTLALMFYGNVGGTLSAGECYAYFKNIQVEIGTTATPYEPYQEPVFEGVKSISPNMTLLTNNSGTVINCNYLRDIDKYINNLTTNIALTGGE